MNTYGIDADLQQEILAEINDAHPAPEAKQEPVAWMSKTGHGTYFRESLSPELEALEFGGNKMWTPLYLHPAPVNQQLLEALKHIADANYRKWDKPYNTAEEYYNWARSRARAAIAAEGKV